MPRILAFDVNETLLDLSALDPLFERAFGDAAMRPQWFAQMLQVAFVGVYHRPRRRLHDRAARRPADGRGAHGDGLERRRRGRDRRRHAHAPALPRRGARARPPARGRLTLCSLTNSSLDVSRAQLSNAGIADRFEAILSATRSAGSSPHPSPTELVADTFGAPIGDVRLIAAHAWDCAARSPPGRRQPSWRARAWCSARSASSPTSWAPTSTRSPRSSSPDRSLFSAHHAAVAQLARASACHAEGRGFESLQPLSQKARLCGPFVFLSVVWITGSRQCKLAGSAFGPLSERERPERVAFQYCFAWRLSRKSGCRPAGLRPFGDGPALCRV